jgi:uncharacterized membrane protein
MSKTLLALAVLALAGCAPTAPAEDEPPPGEAAPSDEHYEARGNEPGWHLTIDKGWIYYVGNYGEKRISAARPDPRPGIDGRRYVTERLTVDIAYSRCNDAMSGHGYEHQVTVTADGETYRGCGGERRTDWDS